MVPTPPSPPPETYQCVVCHVGTSEDDDLEDCAYRFCERWFHLDCAKKHGLPLSVIKKDCYCCSDHCYQKGVEQKGKSTGDVLNLMDDSD